MRVGFTGTRHGMTWEPLSFPNMWWEIGAVMGWQRRMQPALAALASAYKRLVSDGTVTRGGGG